MTSPFMFLSIQLTHAFSSPFFFVDVLFTKCNWGDLAHNYNLKDLCSKADHNMDDETVYLLDGGPPHKLLEHTVLCDF